MRSASMVMQKSLGLVGGIPPAQRQKLACGLMPSFGMYSEK